MPLDSALAAIAQLDEFSRRIALDRLECSRTDRCLLEAPWRGYVSLRRLQARRRHPFVDVRGGIYLASFAQKERRVFCLPATCGPVVLAVQPHSPSDAGM